MDKTDADKLLKQTQSNYDNFAESFSQTRNYIWPEVKSLIGSYLKKGDRVLDIGCGNGRFYRFFKENGAGYVGIDNSRELVAIAQKNFPKADFMVADALALPFKENEFDLAISIAVIHHIPSKELRLDFLREASRILKPGGRLIVSAWDLRILSLIRAGQWKRLRGFLKSQLKIAIGLEKLDFGDFFITWQNKYQRYHHAFSLKELEEVAIAAGFEIEKTGVTNLGAKESNLYIVAKKMQN